LPLEFGTAYPQRESLLRERGVVSLGLALQLSAADRDEMAFRGYIERLREQVLQASTPRIVPSSPSHPFSLSLSLS